MSKKVNETFYFVDAHDGLIKGIGVDKLYVKLRV